jgi:hypothetical protein
MFVLDAGTGGLLAAVAEDAAALTAGVAAVVTLEVGVCVCAPLIVPGGEDGAASSVAPALLSLSAAGESARAGGERKGD